MSSTLPEHYRISNARYNHYYRQISRFYHKPVAVVSTALLLTIFTTIFFAVFAIRPTLVTIAELINTIETQKETLEQMKRKSSSLAAAQQLYFSNQVAINALAQAFPEDKAVQDLLNQVEALASGHSLLITGFNFDGFEYSLEKDSSPEPLPLTFNLSLTGSYADLKEFSANLVRLPRYLTIRSVSLAGEESENINQANNPEVLTINFTSQAYHHPINEIEE